MSEIKSAIITGATGAVGSALARVCAERGMQVTAIVRPDSARGVNLSGCGAKIVHCDLASLSSLEGRLSADAFFHLGWDGTYGEARSDLERQSNNILYTLDAVSLAASSGCKVFVGAGSQAEYGTGGVLRPDTPCFPKSGYGIAKFSAGAMSRAKCAQLGIKHVWCRILSVYGPCDGKYTLISSLISALSSGGTAKVTAGDQIWDYMYSDDAALALLSAAERGKDGAVYCLGSGKARALKEYMLDVKGAVGGGDIAFGAIDYYPDQVMHLEADISTLTHDTGFVPQTDFADGIRRTVEYFRSAK